MTWKKGNRLPMVSEEHADGRTREIYGEIREALGLPHVNILFQAYGGYPEFLAAFWQIFKPIVTSGQFFELGERLRAYAYTCMHNYFEVPDLCREMTAMNFSEGAREELTEVTDMFLYSNPLLLLMTVTLIQALEGPVGSAVELTQAEHPVFTRRPVLVDEEAAPVPIKKIYEEMKHATEMPVVNSDFRAFARWPDFLKALWDTTKVLIESPVYQQGLNGLRETAWGLARELPGPVELSAATLQEAGVEEEEISSIVRITEVFVRGLSRMTLNVAVAKIGLEGGNRKSAAAQPSEAPKEQVTKSDKERQPGVSSPPQAA
jgi:hypothetical protein